MNATRTWKPTATLRTDAEGIHLDVMWTGPETLDRPSTGGWLFGGDAKGRLLAKRLAAAINAGVVFSDPTVLRDVYGKSYIQANHTQFFHGRHMKKSLTAVGF